MSIANMELWKRFWHSLFGYILSFSVLIHVKLPDWLPEWESKLAVNYRRMNPEF